MNQCSCHGAVNDQALYEQLHEVIERYKTKKGSLIQTLHAAQGLFGYLPEQALDCIATAYNMPLAEVTGVVTFYAHFTTKKPEGKHVVAVCVGQGCYARGAKHLLKEVEEQLGVCVGETTPDGKFTLELAHHIGVCGLAPVMMVDEKVYHNVDIERVGDILGAY